MSIDFNGNIAFIAGQYSGVNTSNSGFFGKMNKYFNSTDLMIGTVLANYSLGILGSYTNMSYNTDFDWTDYYLPQSLKQPWWNNTGGISIFSSSS